MSLKLKTPLGGSISITPTDTVANLTHTLLADGDSAGASLVGYMPAGVGAASTTVQAKLRESVSVKDFGAVGDGITDDSPAFNMAIAYANSRGGIDAPNITGTTITMPDGRYKLGSALSPISKSGCNFVGSSENGCVLLLTSGVVAFQWGNGVDTVVGGGLSNCKLEYLLAPSGTNTVAKVSYAFRLNFTNLLLVNIGNFMSLGAATPATACGDITISNVKGYVSNGGYPLFNMRYGAGLFIDNMHMFVGGVAAPVHPTAMTTIAGTSVFVGSAGFWDTLQCSNSSFERFDVALSITAGSGMVYQNFFFTNFVADYCRRWGVYLEAQSGGIIATVKIDSASWISSWENDAIAIIGVGSQTGHNIQANLPISGTYSVNYSAVNGKSNVFSGMQVNGANRMGTVASAMNFAAGSKGFNVIGCNGNRDTTGDGQPWRSNYGIVIGEDSDQYVVTGCAFEGIIGGYSFAVNTTSSAYRKVSNNVNCNYAVYLAITIPASTIPYVNMSAHNLQIDFYAGTTTAFSKNGVGLYTISPIHMRLEPGDSFSCTYTIAPTVRAFIES